MIMYIEVFSQFLLLLIIDLSHSPAAVRILLGAIMFLIDRTRKYC